MALLKGGEVEMESGGLEGLECERTWSFEMRVLE